MGENFKVTEREEMMGMKKYSIEKSVRRDTL
jgi:hypothetical protein